MIDIKSLRLGNWILYKNEPVQVYHIDRGGTTFFRLNDIPVNKDTGCTLGTGSLDFKPIQLTPETLLACGFTKESRGEKDSFDGIETVYHFEGVDIFDNTENGSGFDYAVYTRYPGKGFKAGFSIQTLHQL